MKKAVSLFLTLMIGLSCTACGQAPTPDSQSSSPSTSDSVNTDSLSSPSSNEATKKPELTPNPTPEMQEMKVQDFEALLDTQSLRVVSTKYLVQDENYKSLYPDMLQAVLQNDTEFDIKNVVVAFVAWDENNIPVKIKGSIDFSDGAYVKLVNYSDINLVPGTTYGDNSGYEVDEACRIATFKAIVVSFEAFTGETWENPYFDEWCKLFEGVKYTEDLSVDVNIEEDHLPTGSGTNADSNTNSLNESEILSEIEAQELRVISTKYLVQDENYKSLYPDMLQAVLQNDTEFDIKNVVVAFVAWDENNLPVKIKGSIDFSDGAYVKLVNYNDINLVPGTTYGNNSGYEVDEVCGITTFKAIVVSFEAFTGETWENPYFDEWCKLYEGVKLTSE